MLQAPELEIYHLLSAALDSEHYQPIQIDPNLHLPENRKRASECYLIRPTELENHHSTYPAQG